MSGFIRKVKTASGATAVQIVEKRSGVRRIVEHVGSARDGFELAVLVQVARERLHAGQQVLDLGLEVATAAGATVGGAVAGQVSPRLETTVWPPRRSSSATRAHAVMVSIRPRPRY